MRKGEVPRSEDELRTWIAEERAGAFRKVVEEFEIFWKNYDAVFGTNHALIVRKMYFGRTMNLLKVAGETHVEERTLFRYRRLYAALFSELKERYKLT